jgi:tRNA threonylcarbamoyladenosine biosynthesis protein TsaB
MKILAFDCSTAHLSAAVVDDATVVARLHGPPRTGAAEELAPMIEAVLRQAQIAVGACDRIGVTVGPGHFTGLRVGLATARGLGLATGKRVIGVSTLQVLASAAACDNPESWPILASVDSRRAEPYFQIFDARAVPGSEPVAVLPAAFARTLRARRIVLCGDRLVVSHLEASGVTVRCAEEFPDAAVLGRIAGGPGPGLPLRPFYLQPSVAA